MEKSDELRKEVTGGKSVDSLVWYQKNDDVEPAGTTRTEANMESIALKALHVDDDPSLNPWTFRMWFLGMFNNQNRSYAT